MNCHHCKAKIAKDGTFCQHCGRSTRDAGATDIEDFWGPEPNFGKKPWFQIAGLAFGIFIVWAALASGQVVGPVNMVFPCFLGFLLMRIVAQLLLKPTKLYYSISQDGLSYLDHTSFMELIGWGEMERLEALEIDTGRLKLFWRGHRGNKSVFKWHDQLMTKLTGKVYKGGVAYEEEAAMERSLILEGRLLSANGSSFSERFGARFAEKVKTSPASTPLAPTAPSAPDQ